MVKDTTRKTRGRAAQAEESYEVIKAQEALIVEAQTGITRAMRERGLKQIDLADRLGVSQARVSQMFGDDAQNLTLRTLAKIYYVLGSRCRLVEVQAVPAVSQDEALGAALSDSAVSSGAGAARSKYTFHRPPSPAQRTASRKFQVRRGCAVHTIGLEQAFS